MKLSVLTAFILVSGIVLAGRVEIVETEAIGEGKTRELAIEKALKEAVQKVNGVSVDTARYLLDMQTGQRSSLYTYDERRISVDDLSLKTEGTTVMQEFEGMVKTFDVISESKVEGGNYRVEIKAGVYKYPEDTSKLIRVAVLPVHVGEGLNLSGSFSESLSRRLSVLMVQSGRFDVLDRQYTNDYLAERNLLASDMVPDQERARLAQALGADYVFSGTVTNYLNSEITKNNPAIGRRISSREARLMMDYRLFDADTRKVAMADTYRMRMDDSDIRKLSREVTGEVYADEIPSEEVSDIVMEAAAADIVRRVLEYADPIRIESVDGGKVVIDVGGKLIQPEMTFTAFGGETLEKVVLQAVNVMYDHTLCRVVSGNPEILTVGMACKFATPGRRGMSVPGYISDPGRKSSVEKVQGGGVKMPFDK
ncbi:Curli production assembly/transport component CsgG [Limihaloglobus sulfuriphilus]|uniref:Curli production assembly/transport component CsgG n=1 Tax=Limihaloglobus sulfuriphilus TaxID=1851148 RepID=A0A1Q2MD99_9BACT|nr:CsgG/HfaB family protein [Limihaloglobus sulfuriphilus]AQQ70650.1 Curli production assembly/transport component CsgG [Limihaloglobus sulfuriphilus]